MLIHKSQNLENALLLGTGSIVPSDLFSSSVRRDAELYDCYWTKQNDGLNLPTVMTLEPKKNETLFADVATFHPNLTPISAYTHICSYDIAAKVGLGKKKPVLATRLSDSLLRLSVSLIFAESMASYLSGNVKAAAPNIGYSSCKQTFAFAIGRAISLFGSFDLDDLARRWQLARHLTNQEASLQATVTTDFANKLWYDVDQSNPAQLFLNGKISNTILLQDYIRIFDLKYETEKGQEAYNSRMGVFNTIVEKVIKSSASDELKSSCIAYYCNTILPGKMTHAATLKTHLNNYPSIMHWYTAFACSSKEFDLRSSLAGVGLKVARDLMATFSVEERPDCDISIDELEVLSRVSMKASVLKPKEHRTLTVSLLPGLNIDLSIAVPETSNRSSELSDTERFDNQRLKSLLFEAIELISKSNDRKSKSNRQSYNRMRED